MGGTEVIVVDTHVIIWDALKPSQLSKKAKNAINNANKTDGILFCDISLWEIAMLISKSKLSVETPFQELISLLIASNNYHFQSITPEIAEKSTSLPDDVSKDPADRIIAATSIIIKAPLITADKNLLKSKAIETIW
jgi:PIN domain nuclease of toxin-antitoxin system